VRGLQVRRTTRPDRTDSPRLPVAANLQGGKPWGARANGQGNRGTKNKMMKWFSDNSQALQGIAAALSPIFTLAIIWVTWRYVSLTRALAETTHKQLSASLQPVLVLHIASGHYGEGIALDKRIFWADGEFSVKVRGTSPVKLKAIYIVVQHWMPVFVQYEQELVEYKDRILMPDEELFGKFIADLRERHTEDMVFGLHVDCTDLSELKLHSLFIHPTKGVRHSLSTGESSTLLQLLEKTGRYIRKWAEWEN
jgi:hypothetical protein